MAPPQADYGPDGPWMCLARHGVILCSGDLRGDLLAVKRAAMTSLGPPRIVRKPLAARSVIPPIGAVVTACLDFRIAALIY
jgi:hypothetical protein